jgi:hypothetical protein
MLLDWTSIKRTAQHFQDTITGFHDWNQVRSSGPLHLYRLLTSFDQQLFNQLPGITKGGFAQLKTWLSANIDAASTAMGAGVVKTYDQDSVPPTSAAGLEDSGSNLLADLPSTATWLLNKVSVQLCWMLDQ